jgi:hypothetical protein
MTSSQRRNETRERNATQRHSILIEHGWRSRVDGRWRSPDADDRRAWTTAAAWDEHERREHDAQTRS